MESMLQDFRQSLRSLRRSPGFALTAILTLALGIGANTAIFSVVHGVLLRSLPFQRPDQLMTVWGIHPGIGRESASVPDFLDWRSQAAGFSSMAAFDRASFPVRGEGEPELLPGALVSSNYFATLGVPMAAGRDFRSGEDTRGAPRVAILGYGFWQRRYGGRSDAIGQQLSTGAEAPYTIVGVAPRGFRLRDEADLYVPLALDEPHGRRNDFLQVVGRLRPGATMASAQAELGTIMRRLEEKYPDSNTGWSADVVPLRTFLVGEVQPALLVFMGAVGLVLLIACASVANLMLARMASRRREIAVRVALGASRLRLARQVLTESVTLSLAGGALGVVLAAWGVQMLRQVTAPTVPRIADIGLDLPVLVFAFGVSLATGLLFGSLPALGVAGRDPQEWLRDGRGSAGAGRRVGAFKGGLVAVEVATAFMLLVAAGLLLRSFVRLLEVDPGFRTAGVLTARVSLPRVKYASEPRRTQFYDDLIHRVTAMPGVVAAGLASGAPLGEGPPEISFVIAGAAPLANGTVQDAQVTVASPGYFTALQIPLVRGRLLQAGDIAGAPGAAVIDEEMARRYWKGRDPVGARFTMDDPADPAAQWYTVVGLVGDVRHLDLAEAPKPQLYLPLAQSPERAMILTARVAGDPMSLLAPIRRALVDLDPDVPLSGVRTMTERLEASVARPRLSAWLVGLFAATSLLIAAVGIHGVIAYGVTQRRRELGIRMALGSGGGRLQRMVLDQGMRPVMIGMLLGAALAFAASRLLQSLLFGVTALDPLTFAGVAAFLAGVGLVACYAPARRAARADPMIALRAD